MNDKQLASTLTIAIAIIAIMLLMAVVGLNNKYERLQHEIVKHECAN